MEQAEIAAQQQGQNMDMAALMAQFEAEGMQMLIQLTNQLTGAGQPDPLVALKQQELQLKAQKEQADTQIDMQKLGLEQQNQQIRQDQFQQRLASQERQTGARIDAAFQRELLKKDD